MGYAGTAEPSYVIPTLIGTPLNAKGSAPNSRVVRSSEGLGDLDFYIGNEAQARQNTYALNYPIKHGIIEVSRGEQLVCRSRNGSWWFCVELGPYGEDVAALYL